MRYSDPFHAIESFGSLVSFGFKKRVQNAGTSTSDRDIKLTPLNYLIQQQQHEESEIQLVLDLRSPFCSKKGEGVHPNGFKEEANDICTSS